MFQFRYAKENGVYICQSCGCKLSLEEVRKMLTEDDSIVQAGIMPAPSNQAKEYNNMLKATRDATSESSSSQGNAETQKYKKVGINEIMCNK